MSTDLHAIQIPAGIPIEGGILVNRHGRRFVDETRDILEMADDVLRQPQGVAWMIYDAAIETRCLHIAEVQQLVATKAPRAAGCVVGLARAIGVETSALTATLAAVYDAAHRRVADPVGRSWSDAQPPVPGFRALKVCGAIHHPTTATAADAVSDPVGARRYSMPTASCINQP